MNNKNTVIVGATGFELSKIQKHFGGKFEQKRINNVIIKIYNDKNIILAKTGIGPEKSENCVKNLLANFEIEKIIIVGTCGALDPSLKYKDIILTNKEILYNKNLEFYNSDTKLINFFEIKLKELKVPYKICETITVKNVLKTKEDKKIAYEKTRAFACNMENWPIYKLCDKYKIPVISIRAVFDEACEEIPDSLINFLNILKAKKYFSILKLLTSFSILKFSIKANNSIKSYSRIIKEVNLCLAPDYLSSTELFQK